MSYLKWIVVAVGLLSTPIATADPIFSVDFFASNNIHKLSLQRAYERLRGKEQILLRKKIISVLKKYDFKQGSYEDMLGVYTFSDQQKSTWDNVERVHVTSPRISQEKIFYVAKTLARVLHQESVAVVIGKTSAMAEVNVHFISRHPRLDQMMQEIHEKLPLRYSHAFSMQIAGTQKGFRHASATDLEWLGHEINFAEIKKAFPWEQVSLHHGNAFLVYQDGKVERL